MRTDPVIPAAEPRKPSTFAAEAPGAAEDGPTDYTAVALTVTKITAILVGAAPSVTWTIRFGSDRSGAGTEVVMGGTTSTNTTTGDDVTVLDEPLIPADSFIWLETTAQSGTVVSMSITLVYA